MTDFARDFLEAMRYEHWLRFYFMKDSGDVEGSSGEEIAENAVISVPGDMKEYSRSHDAVLFPILEMLNGKKITMEFSRDAVFAWLGKRHGMSSGDHDFEEAMASLFGDDEFMRGLDLFHGWVQNLADGTIDLKGNALPPSSSPDDRIVGFGEWEEAFQFWASLQKPLGMIQ